MNTKRNFLKALLAAPLAVPAVVAQVKAKAVGFTELKDFDFNPILGEALPHYSLDIPGKYSVLSTTPGVPGFEDWRELMSDDRTVHVFLDGERVSEFVTTVNATEGWIERLRMTENGNFITDGNGGILSEKVYGRVELTISDYVPKKFVVSADKKFELYEEKETLPPVVDFYTTG